MPDEPLDKDDIVQPRIDRKDAQQVSVLEGWVRLRRSALVEISQIKILDDAGRVPLESLQLNAQQIPAGRRPPRHGQQIGRPRLSLDLVDRRPLHVP